MIRYCLFNMREDNFLCWGYHTNQFVCCYGKKDIILLEISEVRYLTNKNQNDLARN